MSKRWKNRRRRAKLGKAPVATVANAAVAVSDMPTLLFSYVDAKGSTHLMLLNKKYSPVRLLNLMRRNRAIYSPGTPVAVRTRLLEQVLRQDLANPNSYAPFLVAASYHNGLGGKPLMRLQLTEYGFKTLATWFAISTDSLLDVKAEELYSHDSKIATDVAPELVHGLKMFGYL